jgi:hypothetical protein
MSEKELEELIRRNPEKALQLIVKAFKPRELLKIGNRSYVNAFKYPESRFDPKDLMPNGGSLQVLKGDMLQPLRDPSKTFTDQVLTPPSQLVFRLAGRFYSKSGMPETAGQIAGGLTDASTVIQWALDQKAWQQTVVVKIEEAWSWEAWSLNESIKFPNSALDGGDKTLIIQGPIKYVGSDAAILIGNCGWSKIIFDRIFTPYGNAKYGIRLIGGKFCQIIGNEIGSEIDVEGSPSEASIYWDATHATQDLVCNTVRVNRLYGGGSGITVRTKYGLKLDSGLAGGYSAEGNKFYIGTSQMMDIAGLQIGTSDVHSVSENYFEIDIDAKGSLPSPATDVLIDVYDGPNVILLTGWTPASGSYDVIFRSSASKCQVISPKAIDLRVNDLGTYNTWSPNFREHEVLLVGRGVSVTGNAGISYAMLPGVYRWYYSAWRKIHEVSFDVLWVPNSTLGGLQLYNVIDNVAVATFEPGSAGGRWDTADLTSVFRGYTANKEFRIRTKGDGTTAPVIDVAFLKIRTLD